MYYNYFILALLPVSGEQNSCVFVGLFDTITANTENDATQKPNTNGCYTKN